MRAFLSLPVGLVLFAVVRCSSSDVAPPIIPLDAGDVDSALVEGGADVQVPPNCDLAKDIVDSPACIDNGIGVFVDGKGGDDTNLGTKAKPFKTISHALDKVGGKPRIYICEGSYAEEVTITQQNAASLAGGLACADWSYSGKRPIIGKSNVTLVVDSVTKPLVISDLQFESADAVNPGDSSITAFVKNSSDVTFRRVKLTAGKGHDGATGTTKPNWSAVPQSDPTIAGHNANGANGGTSHACMLCVDTVDSTGGKGGGGGLTPLAGDDGKPNLNGKAPNDGVGGAAGCKAGDNGAVAADAVQADGAKTIGTLDATGWTPGSGVNGKNGGPGQGGGGGGGAGTLAGGGGGGGGACGGCGGGGGVAGSGGGASVALGIFASKVTLVTSELISNTAGKGGNGAPAQAGQNGGFGGQPGAGACAGGNGGVGGAGGSGGGGAGGVAAGVLFQGTKPTLDDATKNKITVASATAGKGTGGGSSAGDGIDGVTQGVLMLP